MTANTYASRKQKGKRAEQQVAALYRKYEIDDTAQPMPMSGAMTHFKGDIWKRFDNEYVDEVKNQERVSLWAFWQQAASQAIGAQKPALHITRNNSPILTVIQIEDYMDMRKEIMDLRTTNKELLDECRKNRPSSSSL